MKVEGIRTVPVQEVTNIQPVSHKTIEGAREAKMLLQELDKKAYTIEQSRSKLRRVYTVLPTYDSLRLQEHRELYENGRFWQRGSLLVSIVPILLLDLSLRFNELQESVGTLYQTDGFSRYSGVSTFLAISLLAASSVGVLHGDTKVTEAQVQMRRIGYNPHSSVLLKGKIIE